MSRQGDWGHRGRVSPGSGYTSGLAVACGIGPVSGEGLVRGGVPLITRGCVFSCVRMYLTLRPFAVMSVQIFCVGFPMLPPLFLRFRYSW
jgi:hypothetical protein